MADPSYYTGPERRARPPIYVPDDFEGVRQLLVDHMCHQDDIRRHFDGQLREIRDLLQVNAATTGKIAPAVEELTTILSGFKFLKRTAIVVAAVVGSGYATWHALKDYFSS